jgi:UDP-N-acetylglucosamine 2-epimerase (non-hydrolysing)
MSLPEVHLVGGTATEAARLAPVALAMRDQRRLIPILLAAGPDPVSFAGALLAFDLIPDVDGADSAGADQAETVRRFDQFWARRTPAAVVIHGDRGASLAAAIAANWRRIPVVHLDAGRRSGRLEGSGDRTESNRRLLTQLATLHLAASPLAAMNLLDERVAGGDILLTGNTAVDAALAVAGRRRPYTDRLLAEAREPSTNRLLVARVVHPDSRVSDRIRWALRLLVARRPDLDVIMLDPRAPTTVARVVGVGPLGYLDRARLLAEAYLVLTDDGDLHEEALSFGVPALLLGEIGELVESLHAGCAKVVGTSPETVVAETSALLDSQVRRDSMTAGGNPYGDGLAGRRAAQATAALLGHGSFPDPVPARHDAGVYR